MLDSREHQNWTRIVSHKTSYPQGKHGVEITNEHVNKDNSHFWVRISHGLNKICHRLDRQEVRRQRAGNLHKEDRSTMAAKNDYRPAFFISTSNSGKNDRDPVKDPRIPGKCQNDFLV